MAIPLPVGPPTEFPPTLAQSVSKAMYENAVNSHLEMLLGIDLSHHGSWQGERPRPFDINRYFGLEQAALESGPPGWKADDESPKREWDTIWEQTEQIVERFDHWIGPFLDISRNRIGEKDSLDGYVRFIRNAVEDDALFVLRYGRFADTEDRTSPWSPILREILPHGLLLNVLQPIAEKPLCFLARGASSKPSRYQLDDRYYLQEILYYYLSQEARGYENAKNGNAVAAYLLTRHKISMRVPDIQVKGLVPLKRAGVIGSTSHGYFVLTSADDCDVTIAFHRPKRDSIDAIISAAEDIKRRFSSPA